jgi:hypothetical protein
MQSIAGRRKSTVSKAFVGRPTVDPRYELPKFLKIDTAPVILGDIATFKMLSTLREGQSPTKI